MEQKKRKWFEDDVPYVSKVDKILQEMDFSLAQQVAEHVGQGEKILQKTESQKELEKPEFIAEQPQEIWKKERIEQEKAGQELEERKPDQNKKDLEQKESKQEEEELEQIKIEQDKKELKQKELEQDKKELKQRESEQDKKELQQEGTEKKELSQLERRKLQRQELKRETVRERQQEIKKEESKGEEQEKEENSAKDSEKRSNRSENTKIEMPVVKRQAIRPAATLRKSVLDDLQDNQQKKDKVVLEKPVSGQRLEPTLRQEQEEKLGSKLQQEKEDRLEPRLRQERDKKTELESRLHQEKEEKTKPKLESQQKTEYEVKTEKTIRGTEHKLEPEKEEDITYFWGGQREENDTEEYTEKRGMPLFGKILIALAVCLFIIACGAIYYVNYVLDQANIVDAAKEDIYIPVQEETFERDKTPVGSNKEVIDPEEVLWGKLTRLAKKQEDVVNILLVGEERLGESENGRGRTDCMMIATISKKENALKLTSLMRDMYVQIPGYSDNKLNAAYRNGGISLLEETVKVNFGVEVDGYVLVNFDSFEDVINVLGGVEMKLSEVEAEYLNHKNYISKKKYRNVKVGKQVLNGNQALGYARVRYVRTANGLTDDWGRNDRQRRVLKAVFKKYKSKSALELVELLPDILSLVTTDLSKKDMLTYIGAILDIHADKLETMSIPVEGSYSSPNINGMSVLLPSLEKNSQELHKFLFGEEEG